MTTVELKAPEVRRPVIAVNGFIINPYSPTTSLMESKLDVTHLNQVDYMAWKEQLEDKLNELDRKYVKEEHKHRLQGRSLKATYKTEDEGEVKRRRKWVSVIPYPSATAHKIDNARKVLYGSGNSQGLLEKVCLILAEEKRGRMVRKTYLLPYAYAPALYAEVEKINKNLDKLQEEIAQYEQTTDYKDIMSYLEIVTRNRLLWVKKVVSCRLHHISLNPVEFNISSTAFKNYLDEEAKKLTDDLKASYDQGMRLLERDIQTQRRSIVETALTDLQRRIGSVVEKISRALEKADISYKTIESMERHLTEVRALVNTTGAEYALGTQLDKVERLVAAVKSKDVKVVEEAKKLLTTDYNTESLKEVSDKMQKELDPRIQALMSQYH